MEPSFHRASSVTIRSRLPLLLSLALAPYPSTDARGQSSTVPCHRTGVRREASGLLRPRRRVQARQAIEHTSAGGMCRTAWVRPSIRIGNEALAGTGRGTAARIWVAGGPSAGVARRWAGSAGVGRPPHSRTSLGSPGSPIYRRPAQTFPRVLRLSCTNWRGSSWLTCYFARLGCEHGARPASAWAVPKPLLRRPGADLFCQRCVASDSDVSGTARLDTDGEARRMRRIERHRPVAHAGALRARRDLVANGRGPSADSWPARIAACGRLW